MADIRTVQLESPHEPIVSMIELNATIFVATRNKVYKLVDGKFIPLFFVENTVELKEIE